MLSLNQLAVFSFASDKVRQTDREQVRENKREKDKYREREGERA